jgi:hypothetical protein
MACRFDPLGAVQADDHPHTALATRTLATCSTTVGRLTAGRVSATTIASSPFDVTGLSNGQVVATVTSQHSTRLGNLVQVSADMQVNMAVDFTVYPVAIASIPAGVAPAAAVMTSPPVNTPASPVDAAMPISVDAAGIVRLVSTGFPFPVGTYVLSFGLVYLL